MFTSIQIAVQSMQSEFDFTKKLFNALSDDSLSQAINEDHRTIGRIAWHITTTYPEMMGQIGLKFDSLADKDKVPKTAKEIYDAYCNVTDLLLKQIKENWTDETLMEVDDLYGEKWEKGKTLLILIKHEIHHRGQITVLMRQADVIVPDIYGPAKEDWAAFGASPPEV